MDKVQIARGVQLILDGLGCDKNDHNFFETPKRVADAYSELFQQPTKVATTFEESYTDFILVRGHEMWTLCPHHLLPVRMLVSVAYIPDGKVLGLSKLVRIMQQANNGPVMQERFTRDVKERLTYALGFAGSLVPSKAWVPNQKGICVLVEGWHGCMELRGVKSKASTITMASSGLFESDVRMLDRFLSLAGRR